MPEVVEAEMEKNVINDYKDKDSETFGNMGDIFGNIKL